MKHRSWEGLHFYIHTTDTTSSIPCTQEIWVIYMYIKVVVLNGNKYSVSEIEIYCENLWIGWVVFNRSELNIHIAEFSIIFLHNYVKN